MKYLWVDLAPSVCLHGLVGGASHWCRGGQRFEIRKLTAMIILHFQTGVC